MKNNKRKVWKTGVIAGMLAMLVLAFSACGSEPEESSTAEAKATTTTTVTTEATTTTTETTTTTKKTTTETSESTTAEATTTDATAEAKKEPVVDKPKATTAKPASPTPVKKTTAAAPKGHYETIHHEAVTQQVWVEDAPAGEKEIIQCRCGLRLNSFDDWCSHDKTLSMNGDDTHYSYEVWYEETPAQGHYETQIIKAAYDEQVWVQD